jgi:hypothetical protein
VAFAIVDTTKASSADGVNAGPTPAINTTGATLLVAATAYTVSLTLSDSKSNVWTALTEQNNTVRTRFYYVINPIVGSGHTFTGVGTVPNIVVFAYSGTTPTFIAETGANSSGTTIQPGALTPQTGDLFDVSMSNGDTGATFSSDLESGHLMSNGVPGTSVPLILSNYLAPNTTAYNPTLTSTISNGNNVTRMAQFREGGGVTPTGGITLMGQAVL